MDSAEMVERGTILRATVGSTVHGLHHGGQDDRDEMAVFVEPPEYLLGLARPAGSAAGSTASSTTSSGPSPRASARARATSTSSRTACASTCGSRSRGTRRSCCSCSSRTSSIARRDRPRRRAARAAAGDPLAAGRPRLPRLPARPEGAAARRARAEARQPARARRGARLRHEVRDARRPARLPGPRAARDGRRDAADARAGALARDGDPHGERTFEEAIAEIDEVERRLAEALERSRCATSPTARPSTLPRRRIPPRVGLAGYACRPAARTQPPP